MFVGQASDKLVKIYCDESRITACPFIVVGGLWIPQRCGQSFVDEYFRRCHDTGINNPPKHLKWERIPPETSLVFKAYQIIFKLFFEFAERREIFVKVLVAEDYDCRHANFHEGNYENGFHKLYYLLLRRHLHPLQRYHLRLASRNITGSVSFRTYSEDLKQFLNRAWGTQTNHEAIILSVEQRNEQDRILIQMADLIMGAVGYHYCGLHLLPNAQPSKVRVANALAQKMRWLSLAQASLPSQHTINIFHWQPRKK